MLWERVQGRVNDAKLGVVEGGQAESGRAMIGGSVQANPALWQQRFSVMLTPARLAPPPST